jgi:hypothetical protein
VTPADRPAARGLGEAVEVDGDVVTVVDGRIHVLNPTAALVWRCCDGRTPVATIGRDLAAAFGAEAAARDVAAVVEDLAAAGLVGPPRPPAPTGAVEVIEPTAACAGCGTGPRYERHVLIRLGDRAAAVGADAAVADALGQAFGDRVLAVGAPAPDDLAVYGVVLPARAPAPGAVAGVQSVARLHRGAEVLLRSRDPQRVVRALAAQLASHVAPPARPALRALAVGRGARVVLVPLPANRVAYERAAAVAGLAVSPAEVVFVEADRPRLVVGAPGLDADPAPLRCVAAGRLHLAGEPAPLADGTYDVAAVAVPGAATAATALAELGPVRRPGIDDRPALDALLALVARVPLVTGVAPAVLRDRLGGADRAA